MLSTQEVKVNSKIKIRVQGTQIDNIRLEGDPHLGYKLSFQDPAFGRFPIGDLRLEILPDGHSTWIGVSEHELIALLVSVT